MRRRIQSAATVLLLAVGLTLAVAAPARAADTFAGCHGAGVICLAEHRGGIGYIWGPHTLRPYGTCFNIPSHFNDETSALWNKYGYDLTPPLQFTLYQDAGCRGWMYTWGPGAYVLWIGYPNNDRATSACVGPRGTGEGHCPNG